MGFIPKLIIAHGEFDMETDYLLKTNGYLMKIAPEHNQKNMFL